MIHTHTHTHAHTHTQSVIDCNVFPMLIEIMNSAAEYKTRKEAAWAILNATSGGTAQQIRSAPCNYCGITQVTDHNAYSPSVHESLHANVNVDSSFCFSLFAPHQCCVVVPGGQLAATANCQQLITLSS